MPRSCVRTLGLTLAAATVCAVARAATPLESVSLELVVPDGGRFSARTDIDPVFLPDSWTADGTVGVPRTSAFPETRMTEISANEEATPGFVRLETSWETLGLARSPRTAVRTAAGLTRHRLPWRTRAYGSDSSVLPLGATLLAGSVPDPSSARRATLVTVRADAAEPGHFRCRTEFAASSRGRGPEFRLACASGSTATAGASMSVAHVSGSGFDGEAVVPILSFAESSCEVEVTPTVSVGRDSVDVVLQIHGSRFAAVTRGRVETSAGVQPTQTIDVEPYVNFGSRSLFDGETVLFGTVDAPVPPDARARLWAVLVTARIVDDGAGGAAADVTVQFARAR